MKLGKLRKNPMIVPPQYRLFVFDMSGINAAIPLVAERMKELFPYRDHGRPITVSVRQQEKADPFPVEKLLEKIKGRMGEKPVTLFDTASWFRSTYPLLTSGTIRTILTNERYQVRSQVTFVFVPHDLFPELQQVLGKKIERELCPVAEVSGVYLSGAFAPQEVIYHSHK